MLNRRLAIVAALGLAAITSTQAWSLNFGRGERISGSGEMATENRDVGAFDGVSLSGSFKVLVRQGSGNKVELKADRNLLPYIETRVVEGGKGRTLEIAPKRGVSFSSSTTPQLVLELPQLRTLAIAGSGDVKVETMKTPSVEASIAGSGNIQFIDLNSDSLSLKVSGSGDVTAAGRTGALNVSVAGSGDVKARALEAGEVKVSIAGSGDAQVHASRTLKVSIAGSGDVGYVGSPEISSSVAGNGKVRRLGN